MGKTFSLAMRDYFGATNGAYSVVTENEYNKNQVTFVGPEQEVVERFLGDKIANNHGSRDEILETGHNPEVQFRKYPEGDNISLTVSYKTGRPRELRYYLRRDSFKPKPGENWGVFVRDGELWICHFSEWLRAKIEAGLVVASGRSVLLEPDDDEFQDLVNSAPPGKVIFTNTRWKRDPTLSSKALLDKKHCCELYPDFATFVSKSTGKNYQEAHHLIPMRQQANITENLDSLDNICVLSPYAHRKLHHANFDIIIPDLKKLISTRASLLERLSLVEDDVIGLYR